MRKATRKRKAARGTVPIGREAATLPIPSKTAPMPGGICSYRMARKHDENIYFSGPTLRRGTESAIRMKTTSQLSAALLGAAIAITPALGMAQTTTQPGTSSGQTSPGQTNPGGGSYGTPPGGAGSSGNGGYGNGTYNGQTGNGQSGTTHHKSKKNKKKQKKSKSKNGKNGGNNGGYGTTGGAGSTNPQ